MDGHQIYRNIYVGLTEVCARQHVFHKQEEEEYAIEVDNLTLCLIFTEDYKTNKFWGLPLMLHVSLMCMHILILFVQLVIVISKDR